MLMGLQIMSNSSKPKLAVVLVNLGTPDAPTPAAVRRYLKQFLSDPRVIEIPKLLWAIILHAFVLPFRPKRVAHAYASIWQADSPMRQILNAQVAALSQQLKQQYAQADIQVHAAMSYGQPALTQVLDNLAAEQIEHIIVFPLFPQYSATSTGAVYDIVSRWLAGQRNLPNISVIKDYYQQPDFIAALAKSVQQFQLQHGVPEKLLMSFHGIPKPYADKGDPYPQRCHVTAQLLADALGLTSEQWAISFQSRFGKQEWVKPYTSELLQQWGQQGIKNIQVISPAFSADCLETLEELAVENKQVFLQASGQGYEYIPALNTDATHIAFMVEMLKPQIETYLTWQKSPPAPL